VNSHGRAFIAKELCVGDWITRVAADQPVLTKEPPIPDQRHWMALVHLGQEIIGPGLGRPGRLDLDQLIDLGGGEAGDRQIETEVERQVEFNEVLELDGQELTIPACKLS
jgi:hypothetical protein